jgi:hypothetical protein
VLGLTAVKHLMHVHLEIGFSKHDFYILGNGKFRQVFDHYKLYYRPRMAKITQMGTKRHEMYVRRIEEKCHRLIQLPDLRIILVGMSPFKREKKIYGRLRDQEQIAQRLQDQHNTLLETRRGGF